MDVVVCNCSPSYLGGLRWEDGFSPGGGVCSELRSCHCAPAWVTRVKLHLKKKKVNIELPYILVYFHSADKDIPENAQFTKERGLMDSQFHVAGEASQSWQRAKGTSHMVADKRRE